MDLWHRERRRLRAIIGRFGGGAAIVPRRGIRFHVEQDMHSMIGKSRLFGAVLLGLLSGGVAAQGRTLSANDYAQAERFMAYNTAPLVDHAVQRVSWLDDGSFWYRDHDSDGDHF